MTEEAKRILTEESKKVEKELNDMIENNDISSALTNTTKWLAVLTGCINKKVSQGDNDPIFVMSIISVVNAADHFMSILRQFDKVNEMSEYLERVKNEGKE